MIEILAEEHYNFIIQGITNAGGTEKMIKNLKKEDFLNLGLIAVQREDKKHFLKPLKTLNLTAYIGTKNLCQSKKLFPGFHDDDLKNWDLDESQTAGPEMKLSVSEMQPGKDGTFQQIFNGDDPSIWIPQNRILQVIEEHDDELTKTGVANFFPVKRKDGSRFVVYVHWDDGERNVLVRKFEHDIVWNGDIRRRVFAAEVS